MPLVLFSQAVEHICHISRIVQKPAGNALLLGVGGSGKQSISKLSVFLHEITQFQITIKGNQNQNSFKEDIRNLYEKSAVKPAKPMALIITDGQIIKEQFLICINDFLNSGYIPELMPESEYIGFARVLKNKAKSEGQPNDTDDQLFKYLILQVRKNLKMIVCMSPIGDLMRKRTAKFPGIVNCCSVDFFHAWPQEACEKVAYNFLKEIEFETDEIRRGVGNFMSQVHLSIDKYNAIQKEKYKRQCQTTPKSFLELIEFQLKILGEKREKFQSDKDMYTQGYVKMDNIKENVEALNEQIKVRKQEADIIAQETQKLLDKVTVESEKAAIIAASAAETAERAGLVLAEANAVKQEAETKFAEAEPALEAANKAANNLEVGDINEFKAYKACPEKAVDVCVGVNWVIMPVGQKSKFADWKYNQTVMKDGNAFKKKLLDAKDDILVNTDQYEERFSKVGEIFEKHKDNATFTPDGMKSVSQAAAGILNFVWNIKNFQRGVVEFKPLEEKKNNATAKAEAATAELNEALDKKKKAEDFVADLQAQLKEAQEKLQKVQDECAKLSYKQDLATRLIDGLKDEYIRWKGNVEVLGKMMNQVVGINLISAGFISQLGPQDLKFREKIWKKDWMIKIQNYGVPYKDDIDPLTELVDGAKMAEWANQDLPDDRFSKENAAIIDQAARWPLIIDPQLQAAKQLSKKQQDLETSTFNDKQFENKLRSCLQNGRVLIVENVQEELEPSIEPVLIRAIIKKSSKMYIKLGDSEIEQNKDFRMLMLSKLMNPHYKPEYAAMCTILNFIVTEEGLRDQLLANVVREERYELEEEKAQLVKDQNEQVKKLAFFEGDLLDSLNKANPATILDSDELVVKIEDTKQNAKLIQDAQVKAKETEKFIEESRKIYIPIADEGAMLYFLLITLCFVHPMQQFSLELFQDFFAKIQAMVETKDPKLRVVELKEMLRKVIYTMVSRGMFERHKIVFLSQITIRLMSKGMLRQKEEFDIKKVLFLLTGGAGQAKSEVDWLPDMSWNQVVKLSEIGGFEKLPEDLAKTQNLKFKEWWGENAPEKERMPGEWKGMEKKFEEILIIRALRQDRIGQVMLNWIGFQLGPGFTDCDGSLQAQDIINDSFGDTDFRKPMMFVNAPGVNAVRMVKDIENENNKGELEIVAMGELMERVAVQKIEECKTSGGWVILENIQLMVEWLPELTKILEDISSGASGGFINNKFRLFLTTDPTEIMPIGIMERSILIIMEAPAGIKPNMQKAWKNFDSKKFEDKDGREKNILYGLCYFHAMMFERKRYGRIGYNMNQPFNVGDLLSCASILNKYIENLTGSNIPWDDLKQLFGEIMQGGHIVDDYDRLMCKAYLDYIMVEKIIDEYELTPQTNGKIFSFKVSQLVTQTAQEQHIEKSIKEESPVSIGMHPNTETASRILASNEMFSFLLDILPLDSGEGDDEEEGGGGGGGTAQIINEKIEFIKERIPTDKSPDYPGRQFEITKIGIDRKESKPFQNCFIQEFERINKLCETITLTLTTLKMAQEGKASFTDEIETAMSCLLQERIPEFWMKWSFPSLRNLTSWMNVIKLRLEYLGEVFGAIDSIPRVVQLNKIQNPLGQINSIKQQTCQDEKKPLDEYDIITECINSTPEELLKTEKKPTLVLSYCTGFKLEGARFNWEDLIVEDCQPKILFTEMPIVIVKSYNINKPINVSKLYRCPTYKTSWRGAAEYVFGALLKTKDHPDKWRCAGVALILDVEGFDS